MSHYKDFDELNPDRHIIRFIVQWLAVIIAIALILGAIGWIIGWISLPGKVVSPENLQQQWRFAYQHYESLEATARQICDAEQVLADAESQSERTQRRSQLLAYKQNYARIKAQYDAAMQNKLEAGLVRPPDLPVVAPSLTEMQNQVCQ